MGSNPGCLLKSFWLYQSDMQKIYLIGQILECCLCFYVSISNFRQSLKWKQAIIDLFAWKSLFSSTFSLLICWVAKLEMLSLTLITSMKNLILSSQILHSIYLCIIFRCNFAICHKNYYLLYYYTTTTYTSSSPYCKVHIFWEGHKILQNLHLTFDWHYIRQR